MVRYDCFWFSLGEEIETSSRDSGNDDDRLGERRGKTQISANAANVSDSEGGSSIDEGIEIESRSEPIGAVGGALIEDVVSEESIPDAMGAEAIPNGNSEKCGATGNTKVCVVRNAYCTMYMAFAWM